MCIKVNKCINNLINLNLICAPCKSHFLLKHKTVASMLEEKSELRNKWFARLDEQLRQFWLGLSKRYVRKVSGKLSAEKLP